MSSREQSKDIECSIVPWSLQDEFLNMISFQEDLDESSLFDRENQSPLVKSALEDPEIASSLAKLVSKKANCKASELKPEESALALEPFFPLSKQGAILSMPKPLHEKFADISRVNQGYGNVPIINQFTARVEEKSLQMNWHQFHEMDLLDWSQDIDLFPGFKTSLKNINPPSPRIPTVAEQETQGRIRFEIEFSSGRHALFQGMAVCKSQEPVSVLVSKWVVLHQDDGFDIGKLIAVESTETLIPHIPEFPFMPILRAAYPNELARLKQKEADERVAVTLARNVLAQHPKLSSMTIAHCEFQYDGKKLIVFADFLRFLVFTPFVKDLHKEVEQKLGYQPRIYVQRKMMNGSNRQS